MPTRLRMNLVCMSEEAYFELLYGSPAGTNGATGVKSPEQPTRSRRETAHLPRLAG